MSGYFSSNEATDHLQEERAARVGREAHGCSVRIAQCTENNICCLNDSSYFLTTFNPLETAEAGATNSQATWLTNTINPNNLSFNKATSKYNKR